MDLTSRAWQSEGGTVYKLGETGEWRKGEMVLANLYTIRVDPAHAMGTTPADADALARRIAALLNAAEAA